jgi:type IV pilus assembly protein PilE
MSRRHEGITLIEVVVAIAIVGILATIAFPSYQQYRLRVNRSIGKQCLLDVQRKQEGFYMRNNTYTSDLAALGFATTGGGFACQADSAPLYTVTIAAGANTCCYSVSAAPVTSQSTDGTLMLSYYSPNSPGNARPVPLVVKTRMVGNVDKGW